MILLKPLQLSRSTTETFLTANNQWTVENNQEYHNKYITLADHYFIMKCIDNKYLFKSDKFKQNFLNYIYQFQDIELYIKDLTNILYDLNDRDGLNYLRFYSTPFYSLYIYVALIKLNYPFSTDYIVSRINDYIDNNVNIIFLKANLTEILARLYPVSERIHYHHLLTEEEIYQYKSLTFLLNISSN